MRLSPPRPPSKKSVRCAECGRQIERRFDKTARRWAPRFHYAPCGNPCEGGPITKEERTYHPKSHVLGCKETAA